MIKHKNERLAEVTAVTVENTREFMQASLESIEKVAKLQLDASKKMLADATDAIKEISSVNNPKDFFDRVSQLATNSVENNIGNCRDLYEVMQEVQAKVSKIIEANIQTSQQSVAKAVEELAHANSSTNVASESVKSWVNGVNQAMGNMNKMAAQMSEFATKNIKAVSSASSAPVEKATTAKK